MRRSLALLAHLACASACGWSAAPAEEHPGPVATGALRIATWNVHDLFDEADRTRSPGQFDDVPAHAEVEAKLARVGDVLARLDADVVALQEVENLALLERLLAGPLAGSGYRAFLVEGFDPRGIDVGVLSRLPVRAWVSHLDDRGPGGEPLFARDLAEVHLASEGRELVLLAAHLVSRLDPAQDGRRRLQAERARALLDALGDASGAPFVLLAGDLNDLAGSAALAPLLADGALADLGAATPDGWTWSGGGRRERIDFALAPQREASAIVAVQVASGPDVEAASDHRPLVLDLWLGPVGLTPRPRGGDMGGRREVQYSALRGE